MGYKKIEKLSVTFSDGRLNNVRHRLECGPGVSVQTERKKEQEKKGACATSFSATRKIDSGPEVTVCGGNLTNGNKSACTGSHGCGGTPKKKKKTRGRVGRH